MVAPPVPGTAVKAGLAISPFSHQSLHAAGGEAVEGRALLQAHLGSPFTMTASGRQALALILDRLGPSGDDEVAILTTSGGSYVSACVTRTIEQRCRWTIGITERSRALIVIHEWGRPYASMEQALATGLPVIEDCAYAFASTHADGRPVGSDGQFAIYSLPKLFSVPFGGIVVARSSPPFASPLAREEEDYLLGSLVPELGNLPQLLKQRAAVWQQLARLFSLLGAEPFFERGASDAPAVFMFRHDPQTVPLAELRKRYELHGVEASVFYGENAFYLPAHHRMSEECCAWLAAIYAKLLAEHGVQW